jgi:tripartite-type tricarboxylate transporter receptor subunit TctC
MLDSSAHEIADRMRGSVLEVGTATPRRLAMTPSRSHPARRGALMLALAAVASAVAPAALAQGAAYPNKSIRFIVPYPAGGGTDIIARMIGGRLETAWGQQVVVENRAGASGIIGNDLVAKAPPDGYTVLVGITTLVQMPHLNPKLPYDVFKDFAPVAQLALSSNLFAVPSTSPANSMREFLALARAGRATAYGSFGAGTTSHLHGELFNLQNRLSLTHIPYKGGAPLATDLMGGQVASGFIDLTSARAHLQSGRMKFLAVSGTRRFAGLPEVPTFAELGMRDFEAQGWFGMFLPGATPREVVSKLGAEVGRIMKLPEVTARLADIGLQGLDSGPDAFAAVLKNDFAVWGRVVREASIKVD